MIIECDNCKTKFNKSPSKIKSTKHNFCSVKCQGEFIRLDLVGRKIEEFEVLEFDSIKKYKTSTRSMFKCKCSCGKIFVISGSSIKSKVSTKCRVCANRRKYTGDLPSTYFSSIKRSAKNRKVNFEINKEDVYRQYLKQEKICIYSGLELFWPTWIDGNIGTDGNASVDRIDSKFGYTKENIQIIHKHINQMKLNHTEEYFLYLCKMVAGFNYNFVPMENYEVKKRSNYKGCGELSMSYWLLLKHHAGYRNISFDIDIESCWHLYLQQGGVCAISGIPIKFEPTDNKIGEKTASLDRIDSKLWYQPGNVQWVHKHVNKMKSNHSQDYFISLCKQITEYRKEV